MSCAEVELETAKPNNTAEVSAVSFFIVSP
ncbi:hypothetical protein CGSHiII_07696 [Haemophilus influenzae PittII]|nr:hypothetical protein CGSHiII_07696 [Haemophilus influenzae PittII]